MLFTSQIFFLFFAVVFLAYWYLPWHEVRVWLLLVASIYFYASWNAWLAALICLSTTVDYYVALGMEAWTSQRRRRLLLVASLVMNLGLLTYFKYANFFLKSLEDALHAVGSSASMPVLEVILPIGISFYTFEAINYTVDVYLRRAPAEKSLPHFMLFITFFPHLVAGPIVRARDFLPQIYRPKRWDWARIQLGVEYWLMGLFKKLIIADRMAAYADPVFANPDGYHTLAVWQAVIAYALQIFCDFSGYTDMALGSAHMLGYKLPNNFNMPYLAQSISEFWRRWHMSLSSWLRDYLFIPLGGSRGGTWETCRNLLITMTLGGLWHGANWTFVVWGIYHGVLLIVHRLFRSLVERVPLLDRAMQTSVAIVFSVALTFLTACIGWVFFRCESLALAWTMLGRMWVYQDGAPSALAAEPFWMIVVIAGVCHAIGYSGLWNRLAIRLPARVLAVGYAVVLTVVLFLAPDSGKAFIYFQF